MDWNEVKDLLDKFEKDNPDYYAWVTIDKRGMYINCDVYDDVEGADHYTGRKLPTVNRETIIAELEVAKNFMYDLYNK